MEFIFGISNTNLVLFEKFRQLHLVFVYYHFNKVEQFTSDLILFLTDSLEKVKKESIYNAETVWTYVAQNGQCYHVGRVKQLADFYPGDTGFKKNSGSNHF